MRTSTILLAALAVTLSTFTTTPVTAMNAACGECFTTTIGVDLRAPSKSHPCLEQRKDTQPGPTLAVA
ncbi:MAG: hypothetical protein J3R72DRAFT_493700 [Linnemannia gamsii]|nr:MAG: hypothetical protein J3R72DRAFT_493700 [Linnemannia gamsii]